jgi:ATP-dependent Lon protease
MNEFNANTSFPVMPLRNTVLFPQQVIPLYIGRERSLKLLRELPSGKKTIVVVAQREGSVENPEVGDLFDVGTTASVMKILDMPDGSQSAILRPIHISKPVLKRLMKFIVLILKLTPCQQIFEPCFANSQKLLTISPRSISPCYQIFSIPLVW